MPGNGTAYWWKNSEGGEGWWWKARGCPGVLLSRRHDLCWRWLRAGCRNTPLQMCLGKCPSTALSCHQRQSSACDQRSGLFNMHKECDVTCSRDLGRAAYNQAIIRWICNVNAATLNCLWRNDRAMIRWTCNVKAKDEVSSDSLLSKLGIQDLDVVLRTSRMR